MENLRQVRANAGIRKMATVWRHSLMEHQRVSLRFVQNSEVCLTDFRLRPHIGMEHLRQVQAYIGRLYHQLTWIMSSRAVSMAAFSEQHWRCFHILRVCTIGMDTWQS